MLGSYNPSVLTNQNSKTGKGIKKEKTPSNRIKLDIQTRRLQSKDLKETDRIMTPGEGRVPGDRF